MMKYIVYSTLCLCLISCAGNPEDSAIKDIKKMEASKNLMYSDSLINSYRRFADLNPTHSLAPVFLFKAAQLCSKTNKAVKAARLYERIALEYKNDTLAPESLIRGGIAFATIPDPANAKRLYDMFIQSYPTHPRIEEVKKWSEYSGLSDAELFRRFEEKLHEKDNELP